MKLDAFSIRTQHGHNVCVPISLRTLTTYILLEQERWFEDEITLVKLLLNPGDTAIDVGANFGLYTAAMATAVGTNGRVIAFEPTPETAFFLRATCQHMPQVEVAQAAASDRNGVANLLVGASPEGNSLSAPADQPTATQIVATHKLDDYFGDSSENEIKFIKIDAEGHELEVASGASRLLKRHDPVILFEVKHGNSSNFRLMHYFIDQGFGIFRWLPSTRLLVPVRGDEMLDPFQLNLIACSTHHQKELSRRGILIDANEPLTSPLPSTDITEAIKHLFNPKSIPEGAYHECLRNASFITSTTVSAAQRYSHLVTAFKLASVAFNERKSASRLLTFARLATELGFRAKAASALNTITKDLLNGRELDLHEACLSPARLYDDAVRFCPSNDYMKLIALETFERIRSFSSVYNGTSALAYIDVICRNPLASCEMLRRQQLVRIIKKLQWRPQFQAKLVNESFDNLNPWFWQNQF